MNREEYRRKLEEARANGQSQEPSSKRIENPKESVKEAGNDTSTGKSVVRMSKDAERTIIGQNQELIGKVEETRAELHKAIEELAGDTDKFLSKLEDKATILGRSWEAVNTKADDLYSQILSFNPVFQLDKGSRDYFQSLVNTFEGRVNEIIFHINNIQSSTASGLRETFSKEVDKELERFEEGLNKVTDAQLARFEQKRKHISQIMDMLANWKWWFWGSVVFVGCITIAEVASTITNYREQKKAEEVQWDARYWQYYKANNPITSQKIMENYAKKAKELGQEESE